MQHPEAKAAFELSEDITVIRKMCQSKFPVFLGFSKRLQDFCVVKAFPHEDGVVDSLFHRESHASKFSHINVIHIFETGPKATIYINEVAKEVSYVAMEYAPHSDFWDLISKRLLDSTDDKLVRTYFHQLIDGLEHIHSLGIAHLDLKLENLLVGKDYQLKIADFDTSQIVNEEKCLSYGTKDYRAPEILYLSCKYPFAADVYSAGVILFILKLQFQPYKEAEQEGDDEDNEMFNLFVRDSENFWRELNLRNIDPDFMDLVGSMVCVNPKARLSLQEVKNHPWYKGPIYSDQQLARLMERAVNKQNIKNMLKDYSNRFFQSILNANNSLSLVSKLFI